MKKNPPSACYGCGQFHWYHDCPYKYKMSSCRKLKQSRVKITQIDDKEQNDRKYLYVKIQNKKVKMQLALRLGKILGNQHSLSPTKSPEP